MLLAGLGSLLCVWAALLWRATGYSAGCRSAAAIALAAASSLAAFEAAAAFSSGDGVEPYSSSQLFFAIMVR